MTTTKMIEISTADGPCKAEVVFPDGNGPWPLVLEFYDAAGLRPAQTRIGERIASMGYVVIQPDLFHRSPPIADLVGGGEVSLAAFHKVFADPVLKGRFFKEWYTPALDYAHLETTIGAVLDHAAKMPEVKQGKVGTTGYCLGGNAGFRVATIFGDRIGATGAIHPGGLVTDQPDSPHLRAKSITSQMYIAASEGDLPPETEAKLKAELDAAHVKYEIEQYRAKHGFAIDDASVFDKAAQERHFEQLEKLYRAALT